MFLTHSSVRGVWKINGMTYTKFNACMAIDLLLQLSLDRASGNGLTTLTLVRQKNFHLLSNSYMFKIMVGPIVVQLRFSSNGQTNLALLLPPLFEVHGHSATKIASFRRNSAIFHGADQ